MKAQFIVERSGKSFVLYAGLLDEAHAQGLKQIKTDLIQIPSDENGRVAIVQATVQTEKGTFQGLGDAAPENVARPMVTCLVRLAETRAKARALRDAVNVDVTALEELAEEHEGAEEGERRVLKASEKQVSFLESLARQANLNPQAFVKRFGKAPRDLTVAEAKAAIDALKAGTEPQPEEPGGPKPAAPKEAASARGADEPLATTAQVRAIYAIARNQHGLSEPQTDDRCRGVYSRVPADLSKREASEFITSLQNTPGSHPEDEGDTLPFERKPAPRAPAAPPVVLDEFWREAASAHLSPADVAFLLGQPVHEAEPRDLRELLVYARTEPGPLKGLAVLGKLSLPGALAYKRNNALATLKETLEALIFAEHQRAEARGGGVA